MSIIAAVIGGIPSGSIPNRKQGAQGDGWRESAFQAMKSAVADEIATR